MALLELLSLVAGTNGSAAKAGEALAVLEHMYGYYDADDATAAPVVAASPVEVEYDHGYAMVA